MLHVLSDALDHGYFTVLMLVDVSAAFDRVDHLTLLPDPQATHGITGTALVWYSSYLHRRAFCLLHRNQFSFIVTAMWSTTRIGRSADTIPSV